MIHLLAMALTIVAALVGMEWILRNALALRFWRKAFHLCADYPVRQTQDDWPLLSIVVAAKDEEANIAACLRSLLAQDYPRLELIVVDDRSVDRTAEIVRDFARQDDRLRLLQIEELPDGWAGKNHAMYRGLAEAKGEWLFMTDADCVFENPAVLRVSMAYALDTNAEMLSLLPTLKMESFWERLLQPICGGILMIWFNPNRVNDADRPEAYANGQFMLIRRDAYEAIGTHEAFPNNLIEDMEIARRIKQEGRALRVARSRGMLSVQMYTTRRQIVRGWMRIFVGSFRTLGGLLKALGVLLARGMTPLATATAGWAAYLAGADPQGWWHACAWFGTVGLVAQLIMTCRFFVHAGTSWTLGLIYPFGCMKAAYILVRAMFLLRSDAEIVWRGTRYQQEPGRR